MRGEKASIHSLTVPSAVSDETNPGLWTLIPANRARRGDYLLFPQGPLRVIRRYGNGVLIVATEPDRGIGLDRFILSDPGDESDDRSNHPTGRRRPKSQIHLFPLLSEMGVHIGFRSR